MKQTKFWLTAIVVLLYSSHLSAYDFYDYYEDKMIYVNITDKINKTVEVTFSAGQEYEGTVKIPSKVSRWVSDGNNGYVLEDYCVTSIGSKAFYDCRNLYSIEIPSSITDIGENAFRGCSQLDYVYISDLAAWCSIDFNGVSNPLYEGAFLMLDGELVRDLVIPDGVKEIKKLAFHGCSQLYTVSIPSSVITIGREAFHGCKGLASITIPQTVTKIEMAAFVYCDLRFIVESENIYYDSRDNCNAIIETSTNTLIAGSGYSIIPNTVTKIGDYAFAGSRSFDSGYDSGSYYTGRITIPNSVTSIGEGAFFDCHNLEIVTIGANVKAIGNMCFGNCYDLSIVDISDLSAWCKIDLDSKLSIYKYYLRLNGSIIRNLIIPDDIIKIKQYTFCNCIGLETVTIPKSVTSIEKYVFNGCDNLTNAYLSSNPNINRTSFPTNTLLHLTLDDSNAADFLNSNTNTFAEVTYNRELGAGKYGTIMLPFAPDAESLENFAFYSLESVNGETLIFDEVDSPVANTPYLYTLREGKSSTQITGGETTISSAIVVPETEGWQTIGSFTNQTVDCSAGDAYYYGINAADNMLYNVVSKLNVKPYRAYFKGTVTNTPKLAIRTRSGDETYIETTEIEELAPAIYYDLSGRRVENPCNGVYIVNGKKVIL